MGEAMLYYMLGSDPALWPAGERRERELIANDKGYYHLLKKHIRDLTRPTTRQPSFYLPQILARATALPSIVRRGGHPAQPRALSARRPPRHPSRARLRKSPSRRPVRSPAKGDLQQTLADYIEAAGLQEAPNDTPLSRTAISKTSQLTDNALHANDISHMMKRRLKDGSLRRPRRPAHHPAL